MEGGQLQMDNAGTGVVGMKYVMQQLSALEDEIRAIGQWKKHFAEEHRGHKGVLESSFKTVNEQTGQLVNDLINRVAMLDEGLKKEEMRVGLLMEKLEKSRQGHGESEAMIMDIKAQNEAELSGMREMLSKELGDYQIINAKNKEKNMVLFNETVRLGQAVEKLESQLQHLNTVSDSRLQSFEARLLKSEQESANIDSLRSMFTGTMVTLTERTETRLNQLEASLNVVTVSVGCV
eukprot:TRINITY_DN3714_c0_g1_i2.p1 TRINITY_DN3714_c0_g1~~TRINITY_DN3714_c0_g1_i2.p1  ORF type:complete len:235 (+),score=76.74 TRINITY_DN3714_c0_g1_i2:343-1047(+)